MIRVGHAAAVVAAALFVSGCFAYGSVNPTGIPAGTRVAIDLTPRGTADNEAKLGESVGRIEGVWAAQAMDSARIRVIRLRTLSGGWRYWNGETVALSPGQFAALRQRRFSKERTIAVGVALGIITYRIIGGSWLGIGGGDRDPNPRPIPQPDPNLRWSRP